MTGRTLYDCYNARCISERILCQEGHPFSQAQDGGIDILKLKRGDALKLTVCQDCKDFMQMDGGEVTERGWVKMGLTRGK